MAVLHETRRLDGRRPPVVVGEVRCFRSDLPVVGATVISDVESVVVGDDGTFSIHRPAEGPYFLGVREGTTPELSYLRGTFYCDDAPKALSVQVRG